MRLSAQVYIGISKQDARETRLWINNARCAMKNFRGWKRQFLKMSKIRFRTSMVTISHLENPTRDHVWMCQNRTEEYIYDDSDVEISRRQSLSLSVFSIFSLSSFLPSPPPPFPSLFLYIMIYTTDCEIYNIWIIFSSVLQLSMLKSSSKS